MNDFITKLNVFIETMQGPVWQKNLVIGLSNTVKIAVLGLIIGIVIGTLIAVVKVAPKYKRVMRILDKICTVYVAIFRGTPMVVQLLLAYYCILPAFGVTGVNAVVVGVAVFGMNSGAYVSEIMRGGIGAVDVGQLEAARVLGLSYPIAMLKVVVPQAIKNVIPTIGNEFITLIKETAIVGYIGILDINKAGDFIKSNTYEAFMPLIGTAIIYFVLIKTLTILLYKVEVHLRKSDIR
jgi:polar amino acid transport system permease protein